MIQTPEKNEKIPTDKLLKERKIPVVVSKKIGNGEGMALVTVFQNGYAMYQTAGRATVFPVSSCRYEYESVMNGKTVRMEESFFDEKEWYLSLLMIGEDRIVSNSLSRDRNHNSLSIIRFSALCRLRAEYDSPHGDEKREEVSILSLLSL